MINQMVKKTFRFTRKMNNLQTKTKKMLKEQNKEKALIKHLMM